MILCLLYSKYTKLKLGAPNDEPEYNWVSWFVMLFACGISNGIFQYSVYGPIHNYTQRNRFSANPMLPDNELAQLSILQTMFHFGKLKFVTPKEIDFLLFYMYLYLYAYIMATRLNNIWFCRYTSVDNIFPCWVAFKYNVPSRKTAPYHEILCVSTDWRLHIWLDWWFNWYHNDNVLLVWRLC